MSGPTSHSSAQARPRPIEKRNGPVPIEIPFRNGTKAHFVMGFDGGFPFRSIGTNLRFSIRPQPPYLQNARYPVAELPRGVVFTRSGDRLPPSFVMSSTGHAAVHYPKFPPRRPRTRHRHPYYQRAIAGLSHNREKSCCGGVFSRTAHVCDLTPGVPGTT